MKKIIIFAAALAAMTACNKSVLETATPSEGFGYINLGISADAEMVVTKAVTEGEGSESPTPDYSNYMVGLFDETGNTPIWTDDNTNITNGYAKYSYVTATEQANLWKVPAGKYTVKVENLTTTEAYDNKDNNNPYGQLRLAGSSPVTVVAGDTKKCTVSCTAANAKVTFITDESFNIAFENPRVSVSQTIGNNTRTVEMGTPGSDHNAGNITAAYFEAGENAATWTLKATLIGTDAENTYTKAITLQKAHWTQVTFKSSITNGSIILNIEVNGEITETIKLDVTIDPTTGDITETNPTNPTPSAE